MDSLRGVARFARANPPGHHAIASLLPRLGPKGLQKTLLSLFPKAQLDAEWVVDGKTLRGSREGQSPQVRLLRVLAPHPRTTLA
ncbi:hypothetical protein Thermus77420_21070 [Thermus thalpophilus]